MEHRISDEKKDQEPYVLSVSKESEEFINDDTAPSLFLEDIQGDNEVWILECPLTIDPSKLLGKQLHFGRPSSITTDEVTKESIIVSPVREEGVVCCLLPSSSGESINPVGLQCAGKLKLDLNCDIPCSELMIPDDGSVPLPVGLKSRHPFLGPKYQNIVETMKNSERNIFKVKNENLDQEIPEKKKRKKKSISTGYEEIAGEERDSVDEPVEGYVTHRKKKKHTLLYQDEIPEVVTSPFGGTKIKRENIHVSPNKNHDLTQNSASWTDVGSQLSKKVKKEKNISMVQDSSAEELYQPKEKRKKHHRNTDSDVTSEDVVELGIVGGDHSSRKAKKRKSEISLMLVEPPEGESVGIQAIKTEDVKHARKKKKRHTMDNADIQYAPILKDEEINHIVEENYVIPSKKKKKMDSIADDEFIPISPKEERVVDSLGRIKEKIKKEKRKSCIPELL